MLEVLTTVTFDRWLRRVKDRQGRLRVLERVDRLAHGNAGDARSVGHGVSELRLRYGPGYRVYFLREGDRVVLLLCAGDKSTQESDIRKAHQLAAEWRYDTRKGDRDE